jgi:hypothetical protein
MRTDAQLHLRLLDVLAGKLKCSIGGVSDLREFQELASPAAPVPEVHLEGLEEVGTDPGRTAAA